MRARTDRKTGVAGVLALLVGLGIVLATTLAGREPDPAEGPVSDVSVGWLADRLGNTALFAPLGAALAAAGLRALPAVALGSGLSAGVEVLQLGIPGRFPALADILANVLGTALGFGLSRVGRRLLSAVGPARAVLVAGSGVAAGALLLLPGLLLRPDFVGPPHHGQRMPRLEHLLPYGGRVTHAAIDGIEITAGSPLPESDSGVLAERLTGDWRLELRAIAGRPAPDPGEFISLGDSAWRELLLVGPDGNDLVVRYWCLGTSLGLTKARWRAPDLLAHLHPGEPFELRVEREGLAFRARIDGRQVHTGGLRAADAWLLLTWSVPWMERHREGSGALWLAAALLPVGLTLASWPWAAGMGLVVALALATGPAGTGVLPATAMQITGALAGMAIGTAIGRRVRARQSSQREGPKPFPPIAGPW